MDFPKLMTVVQQNNDVNDCKQVLERWEDEITNLKQRPLRQISNDYNKSQPTLYPRSAIIKKGS